MWHRIQLAAGLVLVAGGFALASFGGRLSGYLVAAVGVAVALAAVVKERKRQSQR